MNKYVYEVICMKIDSEKYNLWTMLYYNVNSGQMQIRGRFVSSAMYSLQL